MTDTFAEAGGLGRQTEADVVYGSAATGQELAINQASEIDDCPFCEGFDDPILLFDVGQELGEGDIVLKPALGMLLPGYFLGISKEHVTSFAQLEPPALAGIDAVLKEHEANLAPKFGEYFRLEHGSDNVSSCGSGACIDHAHMHLVPDPEVAESIKADLPWQQLDRYEDIAEFRGEPYVYLGSLGMHFVVPNPNLPSQWVRRKIAEVRGLENWDWATYHGVKELFETFWRLRSFPRGRSVFRLSADRVDYEQRNGSRESVSFLYSDPGRETF